jgi:hypothetical protein
LSPGGALVGLSKTEREKEGKKGGVVKLGYLCAFIPPEGVSLVVALGGQDDPEWDVKVCPALLRSPHLYSNFAVLI